MRLSSTSEASAEPQPCTPFADAEVQCAVNMPAKTPALAEGGSCICDYYSIADNASEATRTAPALRPKRCRVNGRVSQTDNSFTIPDVNDKRMQTARADVISSSAQTSQNVESVVEVDNSAKDIPGCSGDTATFDAHTATTLNVKLQPSTPSSKTPLTLVMTSVMIVIAVRAAPIQSILPALAA